MSQTMEPSLVDYARFYGLTRDHLDINPLADLPNDASFQSEDHPDLFQITDTNATLPEERLALGKEELLLLASITRTLEQAPTFEGYSSLFFLARYFESTNWTRLEGFLKSSADDLASVT